jgi:hypothetical protein
MKLIITEDQLKRVIVENEMDEVRGRKPLTQDLIDKRNAKLIKIGKKYANQNDFMNKNYSNFALAKKYKLLDTIFPDRKTYRRGFEWTPEAITDIAKQYSSRQAFIDGDQYAARKAKEMGLLDTLFPAYTSKYNLENSLELADKFDDIWEFKRKHTGAFNILKDNKLLQSKFPNYRPGAKGVEKGSKHKHKTLDQWIDYAYNLVQTQRKPLIAIDSALYHWLRDKNVPMGQFKKPSANEDDLIARAQKYNSLRNLKVANPLLLAALKEFPGAVEKAFGNAPFDLSRKKLPNPNTEIPNDMFIKKQKNLDSLDDNRRYNKGVMFTPVTETKKR